MQLKSYLAIGLFIETTVICLIASFHFINIVSTIVLIMFNFLFITFIFQMNGTTARKAGILTVGNIIGLFWNLVFYYFSYAGLKYFGPSFSGFYTIIYPILNLMWIVPFWSLSLSFLPKHQYIADQLVKI